MKKKINDGLTKYDRYRLKDVEGYRKKKREWAKTPEQREKRNAYMRLWKAKNPKRTLELARNSYYRKCKTPEFKLAQRKAHLRRNYDLTLEDYDKMLNSQKGKCAICFTDKPARGRFHIDHDHVTRKVRKLLCSRCNGALGWYEKYKSSIINYLDIVW